jgi:hypothetical protein
MGENAAYVFVRNGTTWTQQARLTNSLAESGFGLSVAASGDTLAVGSYGIVYVYTRANGVWSQQTMLKGLEQTAADRRDRHLRFALWSRRWWSGRRETRRHSGA